MPKTAMHRVKPSTPALKLKKSGLIRGRVLDYGCGHGFDADWLKAIGYDPTHRPKEPVGNFDTILCTYVLNTIRSSNERKLVLRRIKYLLKPDGRAFVTVRRDIEDWRHTRNGWQGGIIVPRAISLWRTPNYEIYVIGTSS